MSRTLKALWLVTLTVALFLALAIFQQAIRVGQIEDTYTPVPAFTDQQLDTK